MFACGLALLIAASGMLLSTSGAEAAHRGAVLVKDIRPGRSPSMTTNGGGDCGCIYNGGDLTGVHGTLFFSANDGKHGFELWRSDGTARGTRMVKDINPGTGWSDVFGLTAFNRIVYFTADDGVHGAELWRSDGTARGTRMVKDLNPGPASGGGGGFTDLNGILYFAGPGGLWRSDGTEAGTTLVKAIGAFPLINVNGTLYFGSDDGGGHPELWRSDGTAAGTILVKGNLSPDELTNVNGILYFRASYSGELWRSDGTEAGTHDGQGLRAWELHRPPINVNRHPLLRRSRRAVAKRRYRGRHDPCQTGPGRHRPHRHQGEAPLLRLRDGLWQSDGTPQGTTLVRRVGPGRYLAPSP